jgi:hypothetical protein
MTEGEHLYGLVTESADARACVARMAKHELKLLAGHITHLVRVNDGAETGIPGLCRGLVEMEAAERFLKEQ